ncbi:MAG: SDR family NAD(P)-dependent oxidoreductase [Deltaproteobacteria bacterium]|nr:SDR family NAD(P)-dependent oxidoreductase [Deltaproteobacteria bacterium]
MKSFENQVAVVTGGASGIGRGIALALAGRGAHVALADLHEARLAETVAAIEALGGKALGLRCDVTSDAEVEGFRDATLARFGRVDLLCNNAGVSVLGPCERVEMADWQWILDVNVLGLVRGVRAFVPAMVERGAGHVVNTASVAGIWAYSWDAGPYITSKFAAYGYSEVLARSLRPHGVGVSVLCPGLVSTNLGETARFSGVPAERRAEWLYFPEEMRDAIAPEAVGEIVAEAVLKKQFAIFTHAHDAERFRTWRLDIERSLDDVIAASPKPPRLDRPPVG